MADGPRRLKFVPATGDRWRHETVRGHIAVPVTTQRTRRRDPSPSDETLNLQQRKRRRVQIEHTGEDPLQDVTL
jgi:hypothetical protein